MRKPPRQSDSCIEPGCSSLHTSVGHINRIVTDNGSCYRAKDFANVLHGARHRRINPYTPRHNGKVERYNFDPVRGIPLRPNLDQRAAALTSSRSVERALRLPSTSH